MMSPVGDVELERRVCTRSERETTQRRDDMTFYQFTQR